MSVMQKALNPNTFALKSVEWNSVYIQQKSSLWKLITLHLLFNCSARRMGTYFNFLKNETYFFCAYSKFGLVDLIGEKIYHDKEKQFSCAGEGVFVSIKPTRKTYTEAYTRLTHNLLSRTVSCCRVRYQGTPVSSAVIPDNIHSSQRTTVTQ